MWGGAEGQAASPSSPISPSSHPHHPLCPPIPPCLCSGDPKHRPFSNNPPPPTHLTHPFVFPRLSRADVGKPNRVSATRQIQQSCENTARRRSQREGRTSNQHAPKQRAARALGISVMQMMLLMSSQALKFLQSRCSQ